MKTREREGVRTEHTPLLQLPPLSRHGRPSRPAHPPLAAFVQDCVVVEHGTLGPQPVAPKVAVNSDRHGCGGTEGGGEAHRDAARGCVGMAFWAGRLPTDAQQPQRNASREHEREAHASTQELAKDDGPRQGNNFCGKQRV